jgi:hypothetical protein
MASLEEQYNEEGGTLNAKVVASLCKKAADTLVAATPPYDTDTLEFCKAVCNADAETVKFVVRFLVSQGLDLSTGDSILNTYISNNFALMIDLYKAEPIGT